MHRFALLIAVCGVMVVPARADDAAPQRCGLFCKVWRNVSGRVQTPVDAPSSDEQIVHVPTVDEDARVPRAADLVAVPGELIRKSREERRREQAAMTDDLKRIDALREGGSETGQAHRELKESKVDQAN